MEAVRVQFAADELNEESGAAILRIEAKQKGIVRHERLMPEARKSMVAACPSGHIHPRKNQCVDRPILALLPMPLRRTAGNEGLIHRKEPAPAACGLKRMQAKNTKANRGNRSGRKAVRQKLNIGIVPDNKYLCRGFMIGLQFRHGGVVPINLKRVPSEEDEPQQVFLP
jgi:hypothetical protein